VKGSKRGKAFRVQQFSIYTRVQDPQAGERGLCIPLALSSRPPTLAPPTFRSWRRYCRQARGSSQYSALTGRGDGLMIKQEPSSTRMLDGDVCIYRYAAKPKSYNVMSGREQCTTAPCGLPCTVDDNSH